MKLGVLDSEYNCTFDASTMAKAEQELGESADTRLLEVKNLRTRIEKVPGLKARTDINFLLRFLRVRKFNQERAYKSVIAFYEWKKSHPEIFQDLKPSRMAHMIDSGYVEILKNPDKNGCRVLVLKAANWDHERFTVYEPLKLYALCLLKLQEEEECQIHGVHFVIDLSNTTIKQTTKWTPSAAKVGLQMPEAMVPLRLKRIDYVHLPHFFQQVFPIFKQFMKEKLVNRLCFDNENFEGLHDSIGPENLPKEYGGLLDEDCCYTDWRKELADAEEEFEENNKYGFLSMGVETKATEKEEDADLKGLGGSFRKLDV